MRATLIVLIVHVAARAAATAHASEPSNMRSGGDSAYLEGRAEFWKNGMSPLLEQGLEERLGLGVPDVSSSVLGTLEEQRASAPMAIAEIGSTADSEASRLEKDEKKGRKGKGTKNLDNWFFCGAKNEVCECKGGQVRYGRKTEEQEVWTLPVRLGSDDNIECSVTKLQNKRVIMPANGNNDSPEQCQCVERMVRLHTEVLSFLQTGDYSSSLLEETLDPDAANPGAEGATEEAEKEMDKIIAKQTDVEPPKSGAKPSEPGPWKMCMTVPVEDLAASALAENKITLSEQAAVEPTERMLSLELATEVTLKQCTEEDDEVWVLLLSSGQLRHSVTGKCLGVHFTDGEPTLKASNCILAESPDLVQRWKFGFYQSNEFTSGKGRVELVYGQDTVKYCLSTSNWDIPSVGKCADNPGDWTLTSPSQVGAHEWGECAAEGDNCMCNGEIRLGQADASAWTKPVPVPNEFDLAADVKCSIADLREIALKDPVEIDPRTDPSYRECQCRGGETTSAMETGEMTSDEMDEEGGVPLVPIIVGVVAVLGIFGAVLYMKRKHAEDGLLDGEEEEYGEEEYAEEEEEEEEYEEG